MTSCTIRRFQKSFLSSPIATKIKLLLKANKRLAAEHSISIHVNHGLEQVMKLEKHKRRRGKRLDLVGEEASGAQFFSPGCVQATWDFQALKEAEKKVKLDEKTDKKAKAAAVKLQKEKDKIERAIKVAEKKICLRKRSFRRR